MHRNASGQSDIKKLRRENEHLRREIWTLREECDRLQSLLSHKLLQDEEGDEEDDEGEKELDEEKEAENEMERPQWNRFNGVDELSVVQEEPEEVVVNGNDTPTPQVVENGERRCETYTGTLPPCLRVNCVHPFTVACTIDYQILPNLSVTEVIEASWAVVGSSLQGVRLVNGGGCYISVKSKADVETLVERGVTLRGDCHINLMDISPGTIVLAMSGVPHQMTDTRLAQAINQFGPIVGYIESRYYRSVDTGERLARIKPHSSLPKRMYIEGHEISIRMLPHDELHKLTMLPAHILRSNLHIRITNPTVEGDNLTTTGPATTSNATAQPFTFPTANHLASNNKDEAERLSSVPANASPQMARRRSSENDAKKLRYRNSKRGPSPGSSSGQESPNKPARRKSSLAFRRKTSAELMDLGTASERERSNSISSKTSGRRKLSITGRETGSLPWCSCWGNGCL